MGIDKKLPINKGDKIVITSMDELRALGYGSDFPEMLQHADKAYTVKFVDRSSKEVRHIHVCEVNAVFIDADIAGVFRSYPL